MITVTERNLLITDHLYLAEKIAKSRKKKLTQVSYDELKSAAYLGLVEAASKYNQLENDSFPKYAIWRIIGAVQDYLREISWGPRSNYVKMSAYEDESVSSEEVISFDAGFFDEFIKQLPLSNKTVLKLYYQDGMKIKDIANDLNVHQSRISQILSDSRTRLKELWKEQQSDLWPVAA
jgi:RNA polymerase sigma factor (sigma-70 family)